MQSIQQSETHTQMGEICRIFLGGRGFVFPLTFSEHFRCSLDATTLTLFMNSKFAQNISNKTNAFNHWKSIANSIFHVAHSTHSNMDTNIGKDPNATLQSQYCSFRKWTLFERC